MDTRKPNGSQPPSPGPDTEPVAREARAGALVGEVLNDLYEIRRVLDAGGMGTVYVAWNRNLKREVVVKVPLREKMQDPVFRERFELEIRNLVRHEHVAIIQIEYSGEHDGLPYAVMPYLKGGNLRDRLAMKGVQTHAEIMQWLPTIAAALDVVHRNGALHRDVKPANILFDANDHPFLADFGIATAIGAADPNALTEDIRLEMTHAGVFIGSAPYSPPEAIDRLLTPAYDQYSLATVVYKCLTDHIPYSSTTTVSLLADKANKPPDPIRRHALAGPLSRSAERAILRALSRDPKDRFESCTAFVEAFGETGWKLPLSIPTLNAESIVRAPGGLIVLVAAAVALVSIWGLVRAGIRPPCPAFLCAHGSAQAQWPIDAHLGSEPQEIDEAVRLCRQGGGRDRECARSVFADETPRIVRLEAFELDRTEVTNQDFGRFVAAEKYRTTAERNRSSWDLTRCSDCNWRTPRPNRSALQHPQDPVVHVSHFDAEAYCRWKGARLPSRDEWEFVARGKQRRTFPWGNAWDPSRLQMKSGTEIGLSPVGSYPAGRSPDGHSDLAGNVWEWTASAGANESERIFKGGGWADVIPAYFRSAAFAEESRDYSSIDLGFRCARSLAKAQ